ncbi:MAG: peptidylprolyl isomerase [Gammaproteobacteria bacterium]|nr:peptidylprolyl isomerase [Gammaproteobacteria bacterium]
MTRLIIVFLIAISSMQTAVGEQVLIDSIVAIVDEDVISQRELDSRVDQMRSEFTQSNRRLPETEILYRQVLELMITDSILLQEAERRGIIVTDGQLNQTMLNIAKENNFSLAEFRQALIDQGIGYEKYRKVLHKDLTINSLQRQYSARSASITQAEVDDFINRTGGDEIEYEYRLAHILISLPDAASPEQVKQAEETARQIMQRLDQGAKFEEMANEYSAGSNALQGGDLGWRKKAEIPSLFSTTVLDMEPGEFAGPLRSVSGFHIVSLTERRDVGQVLTAQTRSRHILIKSNDLISEEEAKNRLYQLRNQILVGEDFGSLARLYSVDYNSAANGGDIGWISPGGTVPEYETVTNTLKPEQISEPFRSQFGWHIVEVTGRRTVDETAGTKRRKVEAQLMQQRQIEAFDIWKQRLRDEAYIVFPEART